MDIRHDNFFKTIGKKDREKIRTRPGRSYMDQEQEKTSVATYQGEMAHERDK